MKNIAFLFIFSLLFAFTCLGESKSYMKDYFSKVPYKSVSYTQKLTNYAAGSETPVISTSRVLYKNGKVRTEMLDEKGNPVSLGIIREGYAYTLLDLESKEGVKTEIDPRNSAFNMLIDDAGRKDAVKKGFETVNGVKCGIYEYEQVVKVLFMEVKSIITEYRNSDGFVMKTITKVQGNDRPSVVEVIKLEKNPIFGDSKFELPKDVTYTDMLAGLGLTGAAW
jgi:hypothetical protein